MAPHLRNQWLFLRQTFRLLYVSSSGIASDLFADLATDYEYHGMLQHPVPDTPTISPLLAIQASTPVVPSQGSTSADCAQHFIDQYDSDSGTTSVRSWHKSPARATPKKRGRKPKPGTPVKPSKSLALLACEFCRKRHIKCSGALPGEGAKKRCE